MYDFEVVVMTNAPLAQIEFFCKKYLDLGASKISIYYDRNDFALNDERVLCVNVYGNLFWNGIGMTRPSLVEDRQREIYNYAYRKASTDWVLFVDIDEFIHFNGNLEKVLKICPENVPGIRFPTIEAVFAYDQRNLYEDFGARLFRKSGNRYLSFIVTAFVYPGISNVFTRGLLGHAIGKQMVRSHLPEIEIKIHHAESHGSIIKTITTSNFCGGIDIFLLHFHAISLDDWRKKMRLRLNSKNLGEIGLKGERQLGLFSECRSPEDERILFEKMYVLNRLQFGILKLFDQIIERPDHF